MLLRLAPLLCLIAATAAQQTIYCDSFVGTIRLSDFYLVTLQQSDTSYAPGLTCDFSAETSMTAFLIEIEAFSVSSATLTISSGSTTLLSSSGSYLESYRKAIVSPSNSLRVRFDARGDYSYSSGIRIRIRTFDNNGCPADWQFMYGNCFGTSAATGRLNYTDAQRACNSMRSNLLHIPSSYVGSMKDFLRMLPSSLRTYYTWIGLTDRGTQYRLYWLNNARQYLTSEISCVSGGSYSTCYSSERCAAFNDKSPFYAIFMDQCSDRDNYACSMPQGGTSNFYSVPNVGSVFTGLWSFDVIRNIVIGVIGSAALVGCISSAVYCIIRRKNMRMTTGGVVATAGRVIIPLQSYPAQLPQNPPYYAPPQVSGPPPPDYSVAAGSGSGNGNMGYVK